MCPCCPQEKGAVPYPRAELVPCAEGRWSACYTSCYLSLTPQFGLLLHLTTALGDEGPPVMTEQCWCWWREQLVLFHRQGTFRQGASAAAACPSPEVNCAVIKHHHTGSEQGVSCFGVGILKRPILWCGLCCLRLSFHFHTGRVSEFPAPH